MPKRSAREVIDQAIRENRFGEWLCYTFAIVFVAVGIGVLIYGAVASDGIISIAGSVASILFWPAMNAARQIRKENIAIRLVEVPLSLASTSQAAAESLRESFTNAFEKRPKT